jgi:hypothetical protein
MSGYAGWKQDDDCSTGGKSARTRSLPETIRRSLLVGMSDETGYSAEQIVVRSGTADVAYLPSECRSPLRITVAV